MTPAELTLDDLERFIADRVDNSAALSPYCDAAAVLAVFDPLTLRPTGGDAPMSADTMAQMRPLCELANDTGTTSRWTLSLAERRTALRRLKTRGKMRAALAANGKREDNALQRALERVLEQKPIALDKLSRDELASLLTVHGWLDGILDALPDPAAIIKVLRRNDLLAPMHRLTAGGFVGRKRELDQLVQFVAGPAPAAPLFVYGPGGVGKSTLLARFILDQVQANDLHIAYLDIDRPTIRPEHPPTLLLDAIAQLQPQLDVPIENVQGVVKELEFALMRHEQGRQLESASSGDWTTGFFADNLTRWARGRRVLIVIDTCEEVQFLGPDVTQPFVEFALELQRKAPEARVVLSGRTLPDEFVAAAFPQMLTARADPDEPLPLELIPLPQRPVAVDELDSDSARLLLKKSTAEAKGPKLTDRDADDVIRVVGRNPMCLKLAARLLREEGVDALAKDRTTFLTRLRAEKIQALLYGRILNHLHGDDVRKVAYPGLVVRRIDAEVVEKILAGPCGLTFADGRTPWTIVSELQREAALVEIDPADGSLRHRADVRRAMLEDLTDHVDPAVVAQIDANAVAYYETQKGLVARGEEIYHRLRMRQPREIVESHWWPDAASRLKNALHEFTPEQRLWLAEKLGVTLDPSVRKSADQAAWEAQVTRSVERYLQGRRPESALKLLSERKERLPRSTLFGLEAEVYRFMRRLDEALAVARRGVESATAAGSIDMALELLLRMVVIDEGRLNFVDAETTLKEAIAVASHSGSRLLRFRAVITYLRLQRQLHPEAREERATVLNYARSQVDDEMLRKLREQPVLLREAAAELAKDDPRLAAAAIDTLGIEVSSDEQAQAFGRALADSVDELKLGSATAFDAALKEMVASNFSPEVVRKWATESLTSRETRRLGTGLNGATAGAKALRSFRDYFRAGVSSALILDPKKLKL